MEQLQVLGMISRSTRGSTRKEAKEPNNLGKNLRTDRTVRLAAANCPPEKGQTVRSTRRGRSAIQKSHPTKKHRFCINGPPKGLQPPADRPPAADCPRSTHRRSENEQAETHPQSHPRISQTAEALEPRFGGDDMCH
jgi:hypothetical protein